MSALGANQDRVFRKCAWRLLPLIIAAYLLNYLDRTNVAFAALTMNRELGFSPSVYGFGSGLLFVSYSLFQLPSNVMLHRIGARRWICAILAVWGAAAAGGAFINGPMSFYALRFLLGTAEAGFFPGVILYLTFWFPKAWLGRATALLLLGSFVSLVIGGPIASTILKLNGLAGIHGWRWLFLLEGIPPLLMAIGVLLFLPDGPEQAAWLTSDQRSYVAGRITREDAGKDREFIGTMRDPRVLLLGLVFGCGLFASYGFSFWMPLVVQEIGISNSATGYVTALIYLPALPAMVLWARSSDRKGERVWHFVIASLFGSAALAIAAGASGSPAILLLALTAAAIGTSAVFAPMFSIPSLFLSGPAMASGFAVANGLGALIGGFGGQYAIGILRQYTGGYGAAFAAIAAALLMGAVISLALSRSIAPRPVRAMASA